MNTDTIIIISTNITVAIGIIGVTIALFLHLSKKIDNVKDEVHNLSLRVEKLESKFGIIDERINSINQQQTTTNQRIDKIETENKNLLNKILDKMPKAVL